MSDNIRIRTTPGGSEKSVNVNIKQKFDFIEILSLTISQEEVYQRFCSDYGVVVGRVIVNSGLGVPNAKVSIFIPIDDEDAIDPEILGLYPYEVITDKDSEGMEYNLLPKNSRGKDECFTPIGTFPSKREIQDNPDMDEIYCKYYKFTTTTNDSGDFMIFGVPVGSHHLHVDADISDIGILSQRPYDVIRQGADEKQFTSPNKFKGRDETTNLTQLKTLSPISVSVVPFWGDTEECDIGITRSDVDLRTTIVPSAIFMGSLITDNEKQSINKRCRPRKKMGRMDEVNTSEGSIEMIRYTNSGGIERFDVEGGQVIDEFGTWAYQIPMNLDYVVTSEDGTLVPSDDQSKGFPTRARVRFRLGVGVSGDEGRLRRRAKYLIPHNPSSNSDADYTFDGSTRDKYFTDLSWNKIYSIKSYLPRLQPNRSVENRNFIGIKDVDSGVFNPFPFNKMDNDTNGLFIFLCILMSVLAILVCTLNVTVITILNIVLSIINVILKIICAVVKAFASLVCGVMKALKFQDNDWKCACKKKSCMGEWSITGCRCKCNVDIVPYIPYITLGCSAEPDGKKYAPCALKRPWPFKLAFNATLNQLGTVDDEGIPIADDSDDPSGSSTSGAIDTPPQTYKPFHYPGSIPGLNNWLNTQPPGDAGWTQCQAISLAENLNVFKFDFYNDWINGTIYPFMLKYKVKKKGKGKEKFCEQDCDSVDGVDNDNEDGADNSCKKNYILDTCTNAAPQNGGGASEGVSSRETIQIREGYIKKVGNELYYAAVSKRTNYKLFATEIISLGSSFDCDWQGVPKIQELFIDTTFNKPPLVADTDDFGNIEVSGYDAGGGGRTSALIGNINCIGIFTYNNQCNNIKRLCELGMGLDEDRTDEGGVAVNDKIGNEDVDNPFIRGAFAFVNGQPSIADPTQIPLIYIDYGPAAPVPGNYPLEDSSNGYDFPEYDAFRSVDRTSNIQQSDQSFYFYFGLFPNHTALSKMRRKYFQTCEPEIDIEFYCVANSIIEDDDSIDPTGAIEIQMIGGIAPFTYQWNGPTISGDDFETWYAGTTSGLGINSLDNLYVGSYNITVVDSVGNGSECTFIVPGPPSVLCNVQGKRLSQNNSTDGEITINVQSGVAPYSYTLDSYDPTVPGIIAGENRTGSVSAQAAGATETLLPAGWYTVTVTDSGEPYTQCNDIIEITEPQLLNIVVSGSSVTCNGEGDGLAYVNTTGGVPPYTILWNNNTPTATQGSLGPGTYNVTVTDSAQQSLNGSYVVTSPSPIVVTRTARLHVKCKGASNGKIEAKATGGTPPYTFTLLGGIDPTSNPAPITGVGSGTIKLFNSLKAGWDDNGGNYVVQVEDSTGCVEEIEVAVGEPTHPLSVLGAVYIPGPVAVAVNPSGGWADTPTPPSQPGPSLGYTRYRWEWSADGTTWTANNSWNQSQLLLSDSNFECYSASAPVGRQWRCRVRDYNPDDLYCEVYSAAVTLPKNKNGTNTC